MPRRGVSKEKTREALIAAAAHEFTKHGIEGTSLDAICARAGYTRGAFYVHFRDRDDILIAVVDALLVGFHDQVIAGGEAADLETTIARYVGAVLAGSPATRSIGRWHFHNTLAACMRSPALRKRYLELQREAITRVAEAARTSQRRGKVRRDLDPDALGEILVVLTLGITAMIELGHPLDIAKSGAALQAMLRA
jgi:AcrR family transcriptional regulator